MTANDILKPLESKMNKSIAVYQDNLKNVRAGRANPQILDRLSVSYYGVDTPLNQVATIQVPEARMLTITPWDSSLIKDIEKVILASDIGITPSNDGKMIRLPFPALTEERRKMLVRDVKKMGEEAKVAVRNLRREGMDAAKKAEKASNISEDELHKLSDDIQKLTDKQIEKIDQITKDKEAELMEI